MKHRKILVTGATGFVGRHVVEALLAQGYSVRAVARKPSVLTEQAAWISSVEFVQADVHSDLLDVVCLLEGIDAMVHLAWPGLPNYQALFHFESNLMGDYRFIKKVVEHGIPQIMIAGTCFEYGMQSGPLSEDMLAEPTNPYALAKHTLRLFLEALRQILPFTLQWIRLFYLYGPGQNSNSLLAALDRSIESGEDSFNMSPGDQLRDYLAVDIAALYMVRLLEHTDFSGVVNCASGEPVSVRAMVEQHLKKRGSSMRLNFGYYPYASHEPMAFWSDSAKLRALIGEGAGSLSQN